MKWWGNPWKPNVQLFGMLFILIACLSCQEEERLVLPYTPPFLENESAILDSIVATMKIEERIGQLFVLKSSLEDQQEYEILKNMIVAGRVGGVLLSDIPVQRYLTVIDSVVNQSALPLFIASDQRYLVNNQFANTEPLPKPVSFYALPEDSFKIKLRNLFVDQLRVLNVNLNIGPDIDEALPLGRIAADRYNRVSASISPNSKILGALRDRKILNIAHQFSAERLLEVNDTNQVKKLLYPYEEMIRMGVSGFVIDTTILKKTGQQQFFTSTFFRERLGFEGLITADISTNVNLIDEALFAGADLFIVDKNIKEAFDYVKYAIQIEEIPLDVLNEKVKRILMAKTWMRGGLPSPYDLAMSFYSIDSDKEKRENGGFQRVNRPYVEAYFENRGWDYVRSKIYKQSLILANNESEMLPISNIYKKQFHLIQYTNGAPFKEFERFFSNYAAQVNSQLYRVTDDLPQFTAGEREDVHVIILDDIALTERDRIQFVPFVNDLARRSDVIFINVGAYYNLKFFGPGLTIVQVNERTGISEGLMAQLLFGATTARGALPFDVNEFYRAGMGAEVNNFRLTIANSEEVGIDPQMLYSIDAIALSAIEAGAMPGCQILVAKEGKIIYSEAFGYHTYQKKRPVLPSDIYDIASVTKVAATTLAAMKLYEEKKLNLRGQLEDYLDLERRASIRNIRIRSLLNHSSGLQSNMPVVRYVYGYDTAQTSPYFKRELSPPYSIPIAERLFFNEIFLDTIWNEVQFLDLGRKKYRYSDVNFILLQKVIESITEISLDSFLNEEFYGPMGLQQTLFRPLSKFDTSRIVPTEYDDKWRQQLIQGYVHDEAAALLGGISGNAGLFSNAEELAIIFQMLLNEGSYGGKEYLSPVTIEFFTSSRHGNHRGLGFDKSFPGSQAIALDAPPSTYGHTGFTGTCVWVDPENELIYIFLSNRIHPSRANTDLIKFRVRQRIQQIIYDALNTTEPNTSIPDLDLEIALLNEAPFEIIETDL